MTEAVVAAAALTTGLVAGLFAAFAYAVMPGLRRVDDLDFVQTMRGVNVAILNPVFGTLFGGALVLSVAGVVLTRDSDALGWAIGGLLGYVATLAVTGIRNVPLNEALERGSEDAATLRTRFEGPWTRWNVVRTITNVASVACWLAALVAV